MSSDGRSLIYSTPLGGSNPGVSIGTGGGSIALDIVGNVYVGGATNSSTFPIVNAVQSNFQNEDCAGKPCADGFVAKLKADASSWQYATFLGGSRQDAIKSITVNTTGTVYAAGVTLSGNFPLARPQDSSLNGSSDAFIAKITADAQWYVATNGNDANDCQTVATPCRTIGAAVGKAVDGDIIRVAAGTYQENLVINKSVQIEGAPLLADGTPTTIIDGNQAGTTVVIGEGITASITGLAICNGRASPAGGVFAKTGAAFVLSNSIVANNTSTTSGGGIYNDVGGRVTVIKSTISDNSVANVGGGIDNLGTMTIIDSVIRDNIAVQGGGINNTGNLTISGSTIKANRLESPFDDGVWNGPSGSRELGGGIVSRAGTVTINDTTITKHRVGGDPQFSSGGGLDLRQTTAVLTNVTISGNEVLGAGGGIYSEGTSLTIVGSTVNANRAIFADLPDFASCEPPTGSTPRDCDYNTGGGIFVNSSGSLSITNSTFSGNSSDRIAGAIYLQGDPIEASLNYVTITDNQAKQGGGLWRNNITIKLEVQNSIIAGNRSTDVPNTSDTDCQGFLTSKGHNLFGIAGECTPISTDLSGTEAQPLDSRLGPLDNNGGPTPTHALLLGSPAIDTADASVCPSTDQRGIARPQGAGCDIGAYEYEGPRIAPFLTKTASANTARPGDTVTYTLVVTASGDTTTYELTDTLPQELDYLAGSATGGASYDAATRQLRWSGPVTPDAPITITYRATVNATAQAGSILTNIAVLNGAGYLIERTATVAVVQTEFGGSLVLIVANGDQDPTKENSLSEDMLRLINNAERSADDPEKVVLLLLDGPRAHDSYLYQLDDDSDDSCPNYTNPTCDGRYIEGLNLWRATEDIASPYNLAEFIKGAELAYPNASRVILSLVGHGGGWSPEVLAGQPNSRIRGQPGDDPLGGLLWDDNPAHTLSTPGLGKALRWSKERTGRGIDLLYLDACLMSMAEVAYEISDSVTYLLGSESWKWAVFPYDAHLSAVTPAVSTEEIGKKWLETELSVLPRDLPATFSLVDLRKLVELHGAVDGLASALIASLASDKTPITEAFRATDCFDSDANGRIELSDNYCDIASFARQLQIKLPNSGIAPAAHTVEQIVTSAVVTQGRQNGIPVDYGDQLWSWRELGGLSIYLPLHEDNWKRRYYYAFLSFTEDGLWDEFLGAWWNNATPPPDPTCPPNCGLPPGQLPLTPITLEAASGYTGIDLHWNSIGEAVEGYRITRAVSGTLAFAPIATVAVPGYFDEDGALARSTSYCYRIEALGSMQQVIATSNSACATFGAVALWVPDVWARPGTTALIPINIRNANGLRISASDIWLDYDPAIIAATRVSAAPLTEGHYLFTGNTETSGRVRIAAITQDPQPVTLSGGGTLFWVEVTVQGATGVSSPINLREYVSGVGGSTIYVPDNLDTSVPLELEDGTFRVGSSFLLGDVNGDGVVGAADARLALEIATNARTPTADQRNAGDANGSGRIEAADATMILFYAAFGRWPSLPEGAEQQIDSTLEATEAVTVEVGLLDASGAPGATVPVAIRIGNVENWAGGDLVIAYDPQVVRGVAGASVSNLAEDFAVAFHDNRQGLVRIALADMDEVRGAGIVATLRLRLDPDVSIGAITRLRLIEGQLHDGVGRDFATSSLQRNVILKDAELTIIPYTILLPVIVRSTATP